MELELTLLTLGREILGDWNEMIPSSGLRSLHPRWTRVGLYVMRGCLSLAVYLCLAGPQTCHHSQHPHHCWALAGLVGLSGV